MTDSKKTTNLSNELHSDKVSLDEFYGSLEEYQRKAKEEALQREYESYYEKENI